MPPLPRGFRADADLSANIWAPAAGQRESGWRETIQPGPDRERVIAAVMERLTEQAAADVNVVVDELRALVGSHEPVQLLSSVASRATGRQFTRGSSYDDPPETSTWPAKLEYLVGIALSVAPGTGDTPTEVTDRICELTADVFDIVRARQLASSLQEPADGDRELTLMRVLLGLEHLTDRMPGYAVHLERIDSEVFDPLRTLYVDALGFCPSDVIRVVRRWVAEQNRRLNAAMNEARRFWRTDVERAAKATLEMLNAMTAAMSWKPDDIAAATGLDAAHLESMLSFFSATWGAQPEFRLPGQTNLARSHPAVDLGTGTYFIADAWLLPAALHDRLAAAAAASSTLQRYPKHRSDAHERLVFEALRGVFDPSVVFKQQHYSSASGLGEVDALVALNWPLVLEAKSHSLTPAGRRGAPARVRQRTEAVIGEGALQTRRSASYVRDEGGRKFANREGGPLVERLPESVVGVSEVLVTFERMDPVAYLGPAQAGRAGTPLWVVGIADLLMAADLLDSPAAFHHFVRSRSLLAASGVSIFMESDAVGAYLQDRFGAVRERINADPGANVMLGYSSAPINDFYAAAELGHPRPRPTTGIPEEVMAAVRHAMAEHPDGWIAIADAVLDASPGTWRRWRKFRRRHKQGGEFDFGVGIRIAAGRPVRLVLPETP